MTALQTEKAAGEHQAAYVSKRYSGNYSRYIRRKPAYFREFSNYPEISPVLIAIDWNSVSFIRRLNGVCLLCEGSSKQYDLGFCYGREVWVLYSRRDDIVSVMQLARAIQAHGAQKVLCILSEIQTVGVTHGH